MLVKRDFFSADLSSRYSKTITSIVEATTQLKEKGWGALIVIQRETGLRSYKDQGMQIRGELPFSTVIDF